MHIAMALGPVAQWIRRLTTDQEIAENALGEKHSRFHAYFYSFYTYAASVYQAMGDNWRFSFENLSSHEKPSFLGLCVEPLAIKDYI
ncbi:hypothetical protein DPMN_115632 [Dreissena polymorpha]|uniref:Uncharacterized protein n=1 Tax=Dreissena polymorpha TaxID=45954 RepID=A0A9D4KMT3_DREPO|nr:hypothetical protein DPMN_115632 [Dreissena polymorpha]